MEQLKKDITVNDLKKAFANIKNEYRTVPFLHMDGDISDDDKITSLIASYRKCGYGGLALLPVYETKPDYATEEYYEAYGNILEKLKKAGMSAIYYDDRDFPTGWAGGELAEKYPQLLAKKLCRYEKNCTEGEHVSIPLKMNGATMSLVAFEADTSEVLDLRRFINGDKLEWDVPDGNWIVQQYCCEYAENEKFVNYLDYNACKTFVNLSYKRFADRFEEYIGDTVNITFYDDLQLRTINRRMWDDSFNAVFKEQYGFDPAPYYPALYGDMKGEAEHYRALMFNCRAHMFTEGFFRAVSEFTNAHGLRCTGHVAEQKTTAAPWLFGDGMAVHKYAGACGIDLVHRYMYGFNGLKIVSSAAYNYDCPLVCCEIYGNYLKLDESLLYREAMNAFARGVNYLIPHTLWLSGNARIPHEVSHRSEQFRDVIKPFNDYAARCQTMLRGGRHVCDIALLYPVYSLESQTTLFEAPASGFEFPTTPVNADYMNIINTLMNYCGVDLTVLHPDVFNEKCHVDEGELFLANNVNIERYKLLIVPGSETISVKSLRLIRKLYASGGKIIFTDILPSRALEFNPEKTDTADYDSEVNQLICELIGITSVEVNEFEQFYHNSNEAGGEVYYLPASGTAADGTDMVDSALLNAVISNKLDIDLDVRIDDMPRIKNSGILNLQLSSYYNVNLDKSAGGVFNYIHRRNAGADIYFFANSTRYPYKGRVSLRGSFNICEEWNPNNGSTRRINHEPEKFGDTDYTTIELDLSEFSSTFIVARHENSTNGISSLFKEH